MKNYRNLKNLNRKSHKKLKLKVKVTEMAKDKVILKTQNLPNHTKVI